MATRSMGRLAFGVLPVGMPWEEAPNGVAAVGGLAAGLACAENAAAMPENMPEVGCAMFWRPAIALGGTLSAETLGKAR